MTTAIRPLTERDAGQVAEIYNWYVTNTVISFEEDPISRAEMATRIVEGLREFPWLGTEENGEIVAYAYATRWRPRSAYRFTSESTIYVRQGSTGRGLGSSLYTRLVDEIRACGFRSVIGTIALPNEASIALHEKVGFRNGGQLERIGWKLGRWIYVGYWHLKFDDD